MSCFIGFFVQSYMIGFLRQVKIVYSETLASGPNVKDVLTIPSSCGRISVDFHPFVMYNKNISRICDLYARRDSKINHIKHNIHI